MKKILLPILIILCVLCACGDKTVSSQSPESISVYRVIREEYQTDGELLRAEKVAVNDGDIVKQAADALMSDSTSDSLQSPFPKNVLILDTELKDNLVTVYLNSAYLDASGAEKTILDSCITLTMCSIDDVDYVTICVGSETIAEKLKTDDLLLFNTITSPQKAQVRLYFPKVYEQILCAEYHSITIDEDNSAERCILDALLKGPQSNSLKNPFPEGTIVLSVYTQDGVCSVSLAGLSSDNVSLTKGDAEFAVYSIVNSLTTLPGVKSVQILIEGEKVQNLWGFDISRPLNRNESIIGSAVTE